MGNVRVLTPDDYLLEVLEAQPEVVLAIVDEMGAHRRQPQPIEMTLAALGRAGAPRFAAHVAAITS